MAKKEGLGFLPLECQLDERFLLIEAEFGLKGFAVMVKLLQKIYGEHGYYYSVDDDKLLLLSKEFGLNGLEGKKLILEIVEAAIRRGIFNKKIYEAHGVLTSEDIQKQYVKTLRKRKQVFLKSEYLLFEGALNYKNVVLTGGHRNTGEEKEAKEAEKQPDEELKEACRQIIGYLNEKTGSHYKPNNKTTQSHIHARLAEGYTVEDFKRVIDVKYAEWHGDEKMEQFLRPNTLFGSNFEAYANQKMPKGGSREGRRAKKENQFNNFKQREYDFNLLERQLVNVPAMPKVNPAEKEKLQI